MSETVTDFVAVSTNSLLTRMVFRARKYRPEGRGLGAVGSPWRGCFWVVSYFMKRLVHKNTVRIYSVYVGLAMLGA